MIQGRAEGIDIYLCCLVDPIVWRVPVHRLGGVLSRLREVRPIFLPKMLFMKEGLVGMRIGPVTAGKAQSFQECRKATVHRPAAAVTHRLAARERLNQAQHKLAEMAKLSARALKLASGRLAAVSDCNRGGGRLHTLQLSRCRVPAS